MLLHFTDWLRHIARRWRWPADLALGRRGEDLAHRYLKQQGYIIVARNYRLATGAGEADLIARDGEDLVIVEVKSRRSGEHGPPERAVGEEKKRHLIRVAQEYSRRSGIAWEYVRFDLVSVVDEHPPKIELLRNVMLGPTRSGGARQ